MHEILMVVGLVGLLLSTIGPFIGASDQAINAVATRAVAWILLAIYFKMKEERE